MFIAYITGAPSTFYLVAAGAYFAIANNTEYDFWELAIDTAGGISTPFEISQDLFDSLLQIQG